MKTPVPHTLTTDKEMKINLAYMEWNIEGYILKVHLSFLAFWKALTCWELRLAVVFINFVS